MSEGLVRDRHVGEERRKGVLKLLIREMGRGGGRTSFTHVNGGFYTRGKGGLSGALNSGT